MARRWGTRIAASRRRMASIAVLCAGLSVTAPAIAQRSDAAAAETLFREGRAAAAAGDYEKACKKLDESNRLDPAPGTLFNLADCHEQLGHLATAWTFFREVADRLAANDERRAIALSRAVALEPRLPKLTLRLGPGAPADTRVFRNGIELKSGSFDTALPVDPGTHVIAIEAPGRARVERTLTIAEAERLEEILEPGAPVAPHADVEASSGSTRRTIGWVIGAAGVVGLGVGVVTGLLVLDQKSTVDENCDAQKRCNAVGADAAAAGRTLAPISTVGLVVGGVGLAAGTVLVLTAGGDEKEARAHRPATALRLGLGHVALSGTF